MMTFYGHVGAALIIAGLLGLNPILAIIGAMLPDLDALMFLTGKHWYKYHRKITHSLLFASIIGIFNLSIFWGVITHLLVDTIGYPGIMPLYPFNKKKIYLHKQENKKGFREDNPLIALNNWLRDTKEVMLESLVVFIGIMAFILRMK